MVRLATANTIVLSSVITLQASSVESAVTPDIWHGIVQTVLVVKTGATCLHVDQVEILKIRSSRALSTSWAAIQLAMHHARLAGRVVKTLDRGSSLPTEVVHHGSNEDRAKPLGSHVVKEVQPLGQVVVKTTTTQEAMLVATLVATTTTVQEALEVLALLGNQVVKHHGKVMELVLALLLGRATTMALLHHLQVTTTSHLLRHPLMRHLLLHLLPEAYETD